MGEGREREKLVVTGFNRAGNSTNFIRVESSFCLERVFVKVS